MVEIVEAQNSLGARLRAFGMAALDILGKIWTAPVTALALLGGLALLPFGASIGLGNNAIQVRNVPFGKPGEALSLGNVQLYPRGSDPRSTVTAYGSRVVLGFHEQGHSIQYQAYGLFFLPAYFLSGGISASNPFEQAANRYALYGSASP